MNKKININNKEAIQAVLDEVQKRVSARTVDYRCIGDLAEKLEKTLTGMNIPKKYWRGCSIVYMEHVNCNSYNKKSHTADSTAVRITCTGKDFFLTSCARVSLSTSRHAGNDCRYDFTKEALDAGFEKMLAKNNIRKI